MRENAKIAVIIPVLNEEKAVGKTIGAVPQWVDEIIVVDNGSTDTTPQIGQQCGARVLHESRRGYGSACLAGIRALRNTDVVVFLDGDYSDFPQEMDRLVDPIIMGRSDMVIGSRVLGNRQPGALTLQARFGNRIACMLMRMIWKAKFSDLGPFRAISFTALEHLRMKDPDYGWTVEMQIKAARYELRYEEVPVSYRKRIGRSKISGTLTGVILAGFKILLTIGRYGFQTRLVQSKSESLGGHNGTVE